MPCPICNDSTHTERNCPDRDKRDRAMVVRVDGLTYHEQVRLSDSIQRAKRRIAPSGRGTIVQGPQAQLPFEPVKQIEDQRKRPSRKKDSS